MGTIRRSSGIAAISSNPEEKKIRYCQRCEEFGVQSRLGPLKYFLDGIRIKS